MAGLNRSTDGRKCRGLGRTGNAGGQMILQNGGMIMAKVGIVMGSDSDLAVMSKAAEMLEKFGISYEMTVISAHRMPDIFFEYAKSAEEKGFQVIIAGAGGAAHLPGMAAAIFPLPVIGVPIHTKALGGVDSLYSIVQMPSGIPVATELLLQNGIRFGFDQRIGRTVALDALLLHEVREGVQAHLELFGNLNEP